MIKLRHLLLKSLSSAMSGQTIIWQQPLGAYMPASVTSARFLSQQSGSSNNGSPPSKTSVRSVQTKPAPAVSDTFKASDLIVHTLPEEKRAPKPAWDKLLFGHHCSDHMIKVRWTKADGWDTPTIVPVHNFSMHPYSKVFHYAQELFEGMKAYRGPDKRIRLFRPDMNMKRMRQSAARLCLPDFDGDELIEIMKQLLQIDESWVPPIETNASMYIRPTLMGTEPTLGVQPSNEAMLFVVMGPVGPYFSTSQVKPVSLMANPKYVRAWPGGSGDSKLGSNYAPTLKAQQEALKRGHQQVLWLYGDDHQLTEIGTMNIFLFSKRRDGTLELATPPLTEGLILPGVTRFSLMDLARSYGEFDIVERVIRMQEVEDLIAEGRLLEIFGAGTACVVSPIGEIGFEGKTLTIPPPKLSLRLLKELTDIQYGLKPHPWSVVVG